MPRGIATNLNRRSWLTIAILLAALTPSGPILALQGIGVSPTSQELTLTPGKSFAGQLTAINDGDDDLTYHVYATDYGVQGQDYHGQFTITGNPADRSAVTWFKLPTGSFVVKAHQPAIVSYTLTVPATATIGEHDAAVFIETIPPPAHGAAIISRVERLGSIFYLAVGGALRPHGSVHPLAAPRLQAASPISAGLLITNDGNVHTSASGTARLATPFGQIGSLITFKGEILPSTTRRFGLNLAAPAPIGLYKITATAQYLGRTTTVSRWVVLLPRLTFLVLAGTLALLLILAFVQLIRRRRRRSQIQDILDKVKER